ncbi:MAG: DUF4358 domain-containing protein [[Clostridium] leptum]
MKRWNKIACLLLAAGCACAVRLRGAGHHPAGRGELPSPRSRTPWRWTRRAVDQTRYAAAASGWWSRPRSSCTGGSLDPDDYTSAYVRYAETDFGADDVYIVLPKEGEDENGNSHRENIIAQLRERKDARVREFANYDVYNSASIAENAVIFERGGYVVMLMLEDNEAARSIVERYIPERLNLS